MYAATSFSLPLRNLLFRVELCRHPSARNRGYPLSSTCVHPHLHSRARGWVSARWGVYVRVTARGSCFVSFPPHFPPVLRFFSTGPVTIKDRSHVPASRLSIVRRSSRVSRFSHKTRGTTLDRRQSAIIIRVPGDPRLRAPVALSSRSR